MAQGDGGRTSPVADWLVRQASAAINGVRSAVQPSPPASQFGGLVVLPVPVAQRREPWFGPGKPMVPTAPPDDVAGRAFDYLNGQNMGNTPRQYSGVSFEQLRGLADSLDIVRLCIETRKDQMGRLTYSVLPKQTAGEALRAPVDARCSQLEAFFASPDKKHTWDGWLRMLIEDQLVIDAATLYVRRTRGGDVYAIEVVAGQFIKPLLDVTGRTPAPPEAGYQHILKGMPAINYTSDELLYAPRNPRSDKIYGLSPVEQMVMTINIAIRREIVKLKTFTENNIPEALVSVPKEWTPDQVTRFQTMWDALLKAQQNSAGLKFVPGGMVYQPTRSDQMLMGPFDEWIARVVCFAFSLSPTAFVQQQNRATAETATQTALEEGLAPMMVWFKGLMDRIVQQVFGYEDLEFTWDDTKQIETSVERSQDLADVAAGILSRDEVRAKRGLDPIGVGPAITAGPNGIIFLDDLMEAKRTGLTKIQAPGAAPAPQQLDELGNPVPPGMPGTPPNAITQQQIAGPPGSSAPPNAITQLQIAGPQAPAAAPPPTPAPAIGRGPAGGDPLAGIPASILAAIGLGPNGSSKRVVDVTKAEQAQSDPMTAAVGHPQVLDTLRQVEAMHRAVAARGRRR